MEKTSNLTNIGSEAIRRLRKNKLAEGKPFMINSSDLPNMQSYLEFPDHTIKIVTISSNNRTFEIISTLSEHQASQLRLKYNLH